MYSEFALFLNYFNNKYINVCSFNRMYTLHKYSKYITNEN